MIDFKFFSLGSFADSEGPRWVQAKDYCVVCGCRKGSRGNTERPRR